MYFLFPALAAVILDQLTKYLVRGALALGESIPVLPHIFHLTHIENTGAAFGILAGQRVLFLILTAVIVCVMCWLYRQLARKKSLMAVCLGLVVGGAVGNLIDRLLRGSVTDFFDFQIWPVFNVADICVCVGLALMCALLIFRKEDF